MATNSRKAEIRCDRDVILAKADSIALDREILRSILVNELQDLREFQGSIFRACGMISQ